VPIIVKSGILLKKERRPRGRTHLIIKTEEPEQLEVTVDAWAAEDLRMDAPIQLTITQ
jgi:hypothetical protein